MKTLTLCVLILTAAVNATAGKPVPKVDIPITNYVTDYGANNVPYLVQSDALGAYRNGVDSVTSILVANGYNGIVDGDWRLDMVASARRTVAITFDPANAVQPGDPGYLAPANPPWWGTRNVAVRTENKCTLINRNVLTMHAGDKFTCPTLIRLAPLGSNSDYYRLHLGWGEPGTQEVQVSCNSADSGGCNDWFLDPIPVVNPDGSTSAGRTRARLNFNASGHGKSTTTNEGDFYLTFHIHATRP